MKGKGDSGTQALDRALDLFEQVLRDRGRTPLARLAARLEIPVSTAHRLVAAFERRHLIARGARGHYLAGMGLADLAPDRRLVLIQASRPLLRRLARQEKRTAHLGILEADMVTYLVKEAGGGTKLFTRELMQLEAYCTGIGKVLLAGLEPAARERYLAGGPFVRLTATTMTDPAELRASLAEIACAGHAVDDAEMAEGLHCLAVPLHDGQGRVTAAISLTGEASPATEDARRALLDALEATAQAIESRLYG
ncbi:IclR family transcriptional regulator [Zavarzinia compransoris]|uniref:IclR family transcriptional regulator n=1 Tax=Zavarzinia marina TaxID=2911065 RepID=UPI001F178859|nr:IclR family transcriptional regulator [Zavarzinia marina]MCF4167619.1 IclR family transcriptional regulator [Zavarzinia marina]